MPSSELAGKIIQSNMGIKHKGSLVLTFNSEETNSSLVDVVIKSEDDGISYDFLLQYPTPVIQLFDENNNDITDTIKNIDKFEPYSHSIGWENGSYFENADPEDFANNLDYDDYATEEEYQAALIDEKQRMLKAMHCDLSSLSDDMMRETWKRYADGEIPAHNYLHQLFAANLMEDDGTVYASYYESDCEDLGIVVSYKIEWEGDFDADKLKSLILCEVPFSKIPTLERLDDEEAILLNFIIYDDKMFEADSSDIKAIYEEEEVELDADLREKLGTDDFEYYDDISKSDFEEDDD